MFAPRGYTAVPQEDVEQDDDKDDLASSYEERKPNLTSPKTVEGMPSEKCPAENEVAGEKDARSKRNRVRFESKSVEEKQEPMSKARRICFVISLMICTVTIFVFAFTLPCKHAACKVTNIAHTTTTTDDVVYHGNWTISFPSYSSLARVSFYHETSQDGELIINYRDSGLHQGNTQTRNISQKDSNELGGILSLGGKYGNIVWSYNASHAVKLIGCTSEKETEICLIENSRGELQLIEARKNRIIWSTGILINSMSPGIIVNIADCDGDGVRDVLLSYNQFNKTHSQSSNHSTRSRGGQIRVVSGKTGRTIGGILTIPQTHLIQQISLHSTSLSTNIIFVLTVGSHGQLKVVPIQKFYEKVLEAKSGRSTGLFENSSATLLSQSVSLKHAPLVKDVNQDFQEDIVLVTLAGNTHSLTAIDGGKLEKMWRISFGSRKIFSQPVIGYFNEDDIPDILVVLQDPVLAILNQSLIQILNGKNGDILWSRHFKISQSTSPLSASIGRKRDMFLLWIEKEKAEKYTKIVPSKKPKKNKLPGKSSSSSTHAETLLKLGRNSDTHANNKSFYHPRHRRDEEFSRMQSSQKPIKSSIREMEEELDTLVEEVNQHYSEPRGQTELSKHKKSRHTVKLLDKMLKKEIRQPLRIRTGSNSNTRGALEERKANNILTTATNTPSNVNPRDHFLSRIRALKKELLAKQLSKDSLQKQVEIRDEADSMAERNENHKEQRRKESQNNITVQVHSAHFDDLSKSDQKLSTNLSSSAELQTDAMDISKKSNTSMSLSNVGEIPSNGASVKMNGISKTENISSQLKRNSNLTQEKRLQDFEPPVKIRGWRLTNRSGMHEVYSDKHNDRKWRNRNVDMLEQANELNTSSSLHSKLTNLRELRNDGISNGSIAQNNDSLFGIALNVKLAQENDRVSAKNMSSVQKINERLPSSFKRSGKNDRNETDPVLGINQHDHKNQSQNTTPQANVTSENNSSFKSLGANLVRQVSTMSERPKTSNATMKNHNNRSVQQFNERKQPNRYGSRENHVSPKMPDINLRHTHKQAGGCKEGASFALIAIFPKSRKNSFTVIAQEDGFYDKAAISQTACDIYWPWINSNPIVRDVDRDGFLEIFYVVNYGKKKELKTLMKVKKFSIKLNRR